jgi:hypothetical protein
MGRATVLRSALRSRILRIVGFVLLPLFVITCLLVINTVNPMRLAFVASFDIVNATAEEILVAPIGAVGSDGQRYPLPLASARCFGVIPQSDLEFAVPPGATLALAYDWDDIQFSEILCRTRDGAHRALPAGLHPTQGQYRRPREKRFEIADLNALELATDLQLAALRVPRRSIWLLYGLAAAGLLSPLCLWLGYRGRGATAGRSP